MVLHIQIFQGYESKAADKYRNGSREDARAAMCRIEDHYRNRDFRQARQHYHNNRSSLEQYRGDILNIFSFTPKIRNVDRVEDTESESSDDGADSSSDDDDNRPPFIITDVQMQVEQEMGAFYSDMANLPLTPTSTNNSTSNLLPSVDQPVEQLIDQVFGDQLPSTAELEECSWCHVFFKRRGLKIHKSRCTKKPRPQQTLASITSIPHNVI